MAETRVERRLAAILAADVAGYSRLMSADEGGTLSALQAHRREQPKVTVPTLVMHKREDQVQPFEAGRERGRRMCWPPNWGGLDMLANSHPYSEKFRSADKTCRPLYGRQKVQQTDSGRGGPA
jgi:pimeloyl-ACP methyl ester carboxylesterase